MPVRWLGRMGVATVGTSEAGAGGHICAGETGEVVGEGDTVFGAGDGATIDQDVGAGGEVRTPGGDLTGVGGQNALVDDLVTQQDGPGFAVADQADHTHIGAGCQGGGDLADGIAGGADGDHIAAGQFLLGNLVEQVLIDKDHIAGGLGLQHWNPQSGTGSQGGSHPALQGFQSELPGRAGGDGHGDRLLMRNRMRL